VVLVRILGVLSKLDVCPGKLPFLSCQLCFLKGRELAYEREEKISDGAPTLSPRHVSIEKDHFLP
jgi:hypothetical protein